MNRKLWCLWLAMLLLAVTLTAMFIRWGAPKPPEEATLVMREVSEDE